MDTMAFHLRPGFVLLTVSLFCIFSTRADIGYSSWQVETHMFAKNLAEAVVKLMKKVSASEDLSVVFSDLTKAVLENINKPQILSNLAQDLATFFRKRMKALENLAAVAEDAIGNYTFNPTLQKGDIKYVNMRRTEESGLNFEYNADFNSDVSFATSGIHVPVEIYEGYLSIQNEIKWSKAMDSAFRQNWREDPTIRWQFFGSATGMLRLYPASQWKVLKDIPDLYDVRRRPWYIQSSSSPKDMLIMMDTSGSVHGPTLQIMKLAVKTLLNTLGENDFVNVAWFTKQAGWVSCFETFVPANAVNKMVLFSGVNKLMDENMAIYANALKFAFDEFERFNRTRNPLTEGADCHRTLMIFTDGGTEDPTFRSEELNKDNNVRIFTFGIGPQTIPIHTIKSLACKNRGYFIIVPAPSAIRTKVQEYMKVLSRPMVLSGEKSFQWTNYYLDAMDTGMVTTVTLPVYNVYNSSNQEINQDLVGVVGIDIPTQHLQDFLSKEQVGPLGYFFIINHNGLIVYHPQMMSTQQRESLGENYLGDPPVIDLLDIEGKDLKIQALRKNMLDLKTGNIVAESVETMIDMKYAKRIRKHYFYEPIVDTEFSLALVLPKDKRTYTKVMGMDTSKGLEIREGEDMIAPWKFCDGYDVGNVSALSELIKRGLCDGQMIQRLLRDIQKTKSLHHTWNQHVKDISKSTSFQLICLFLITEGGLIKVYPKRALTEFDINWQEYYKKAMYSDWNWVFSSHIEQDQISENETEVAVITAISSIIIITTSGGDKPAVVGIKFREESLWDMVVNGQFDEFGVASDKMPLYKKEQVPCHNQNIYCYLIDDGGYVVTTNQPDRLDLISKFLGEVDPELMLTLYREKVLARKNTYNFQANCPEKTQETASASSNIKILPLTNLLNHFTLHNCLDAIAWIYLKFNVWSWFQTFWTDSVDAMFEYGSLIEGTQPCVTVQQQYYWYDGLNASFSGNFICSNCTRKISSNRLTSTNLLLVVAQPPCTSEICDYIPKLLPEPKEVSHEELCQRPALPRRNIFQCYDYDKREDYSDCSDRSSLVSPVNIHLLLSLLFYHFVRG